MEKKKVPVFNVIQLESALFADFKIDSSKTLSDKMWFVVLISARLTVAQSVTVRFSL